jgi:hypothetical protein
VDRGAALIRRKPHEAEMSDPKDPRSEAEKARADLVRNDQMGLAPPESPEQVRPSVTPEAFGERTDAGYEPPVTREGRDDPMPEAP